MGGTWGDTCVAAFAAVVSPRAASATSTGGRGVERQAGSEGTGRCGNPVDRDWWGDSYADEAFVIAADGHGNGNGKRQFEAVTDAGYVWSRYCSGSWRGWYRYH